MPWRQSPKAAQETGFLIAEVALERETIVGLGFVVGRAIARQPVKGLFEACYDFRIQAPAIVSRGVRNPIPQLGRKPKYKPMGQGLTSHVAELIAFVRLRRPTPACPGPSIESLPTRPQCCWRDR